MDNSTTLLRVDTKSSTTDWPIGDGLRWQAKTLHNQFRFDWLVNIVYFNFKKCHLVIKSLKHRPFCDTFLSSVSWRHWQSTKENISTAFTESLEAADVQRGQTQSWKMLHKQRLKCYCVLLLLLFLMVLTPPMIFHSFFSCMHHRVRFQMRKYSTKIKFKYQVKF